MEVRHSESRALNDDHQQTDRRNTYQNSMNAAHVHSYLPGVSRVLVHGNFNYENSFVDHQSLSKLAILNMRHIVIFPGSSLPLRLRDPRWIQYISRKVDDVRNVRNFSELNLFIGMIPTSDRLSNISVGSIGTLTVVESTNVLEDDQLSASQNVISDHDEIVLTVQGIRRFRIISKNSTRTAIGDIALYDVELLNDRDLEYLPLSVASRIKPTNKIPPTRAIDMMGSLLLNEMNYLSSITSIPIHIWISFSPKVLIAKIRQILVEEPSWQGLIKCEEFCDLFSSRSPSPSEACFWLASNLPLSNLERKDILEMDCVIDMLRYLFDKLNSDLREFICCRRCGCFLSDAKEMFTVGVLNNGTCGAYVNEHGFIHQTMTLRDAFRSNIALQGLPETKDSWFPGYAWTIAGCRYCYNHLGWLFSKVENESLDRDYIASDESPKTFWGFSLASIKSISQKEYNQHFNSDSSQSQQSEDETVGDHEVEEDS